MVSLEELNNVIIGCCALVISVEHLLSKKSLSNDSFCGRYFE